VEQLRGRARSETELLLLCGDNPKMREIREIIEQVADTDITVLVRGESGTGKELVARTLFQLSDRRDRPFVKVNCAALPSELLESELFGFEKGAFTGAQKRKLGKFEYANQGTIFLDEISEMHPGLQAKLLQVLQDGEFSRLGGESDVHVDTRIIAATNCNLEEAVAKGTFREDLYYRLNVVTVHLPPLRDRMDGVPLLVDHFLQKNNEQYRKNLRQLTPETMEIFMRYGWPCGAWSSWETSRRCCRRSPSAARRPPGGATRSPRRWISTRSGPTSRTAKESISRRSRGVPLKLPRNESSSASSSRPGGIARKPLRGSRSPTRRCSTR
jgi:transcriptional regulator with PAS, ATPase and Fis domain